MPDMRNSWRLPNNRIGKRNQLFVDFGGVKGARAIISIGLWCIGVCVCVHFTSHSSFPLFPFAVLPERHPSKYPFSFWLLICMLWYLPAWCFWNCFTALYCWFSTHETDCFFLFFTEMLRRSLSRNVTTTPHRAKNGRRSIVCVISIQRLRTIIVTPHECDRFFCSWNNHHRPLHPPAQRWPPKSIKSTIWSISPLPVNQK